MTKKTKILIGVGAVALAYYLYTKSKGTTTTTPPNNTPTNPCGENEVPCANGSGKCYMVNAQYAKDPCKIDNPNPSNTDCKKGIFCGLNEVKIDCKCVKKSDGSPCDVVVGGVLGIYPNGGIMKNGICVASRSAQNSTVLH